MTFSDPPLPDPSARPASGVGRDLPALLALHHELSSSAGGVVFLEGPRGVGKASLLIALRRELATAGRLVLLGRAEHSATAPYAVIREPVGQALAFLESRGLAERFLEKHATALGVVLPKLGLGVPAQARDKMSFFESMRAFFLELSEVSAPTLLLTDAHDADDDTRELIRFLAVHLFHPDGFGGDPAEGFSGVMMIASRTDDEEGARAVAQLRGGQRMREFLVSGMQKSELMDYLASHPAMDKLLAASHGRPEDVDELLDALPPNTDELLYRKVEDLAPAEQITLQALAVLGRPASPDLVSSVLQRPISHVAQALASLVEHRLLSRRLHNGELLFTFSRPHHQDVLRFRLDEKTKRDLHLAIGVALEQRGGGSDHDAILAFHFLRGATPARGVPYALAASERLLVTFAYGSASDMVQTALPHADPDQRFALLGQLVEAERLRGQLASAQEAASQMQSIATAEQLPQVLRRLAELSSGRGEQRKALEILRQALSLESNAKDEESLPEQALVLAAMSEVSYGLGELEDAGRFASDALEASSGNVQMSFRLRIDNTVAKIAYSRERFEEAETLFLDNLRLAEVNELETEAMQARVNIGLCRFRLGRYDSAREALERALG
jgi:tetratricopeptide (TPR) repeat protein